MMRVENKTVNKKRRIKKEICQELKYQTENSKVKVITQRTPSSQAKGTNSTTFLT